jgi:hypothetical protein
MRTSKEAQKFDLRLHTRFLEREAYGDLDKILLSQRGLKCALCTLKETLAFSHSTSLESRLPDSPPHFLLKGEAYSNPNTTSTPKRNGELFVIHSLILTPICLYEVHFLNALLLFFCRAKLTAIRTRFRRANGTDNSSSHTF